MGNSSAVEHSPGGSLNAGLIPYRQGKQHRAVALILQIRLHGGAHRMPRPLCGDRQAGTGFITQIAGRAANAAGSTYDLREHIGFVIKELRIALALRSFQGQGHAPSSEERRVGNECASTGRFWWSPYN